GPRCSGRILDARSPRCLSTNRAASRSPPDRPQAAFAASNRVLLAGLGTARDTGALSRSARPASPVKDCRRQPAREQRGIGADPPRRTPSGRVPGGGVTLALVDHAERREWVSGPAGAESWSTVRRVRRVDRWSGGGSAGLGT